MRRTWIAVVCTLLLVLLAGNALFFATVGRGCVGGWLRAAARETGPAWTGRLLRGALSLNPYDTEARLALAELYRSLGENGQAEALLREGISRWCTGPELYLALARSYCAPGRMEDAFSLLETAPRGYISQRLLGARPKNAQAPPSGTYPAGTALSLRPGEGDPWFSLDGEGWQPYTAPLTLEAGEHTLRVSTLSREGIPALPADYVYTVAEPLPAWSRSETLRCPHCGERFTRQLGWGK